MKIQSAESCLTQIKIMFGAIRFAQHELRTAFDGFPQRLVQSQRVGHHVIGGHLLAKRAGLLHPVRDGIRHADDEGAHAGVTVAQALHQRDHDDKKAQGPNESQDVYDQGLPFCSDDKMYGKMEPTSMSSANKKSLNGGRGRTRTFDLVIISDAL
jgi:hypothetical protein